MVFNNRPKKLIRNLGNKLGLAWWAKVETATPSATFWYGPFLTKQNLNKNLFCESNPIPVKWALNQMGMIKKGIRLPLVELNQTYRDSLKESLNELNLI